VLDARVDDHEPVRLVLAVAVSAAVAVPALAAGIDPADLVLRQADVPAGFRVDRDDTGVQKNPAAFVGNREARALAARSGRVTGYEAKFDGDAAAIYSRADVFKTSAGARMVLRFFDREMRRSGIRGLKRSPSSIGAEAWVYGGRSPAMFTVVVWRHGRVWAGAAGMGVSRATTLALARAQERRIAAALG
jgi:hypothetical protein